MNRTERMNRRIFLKGAAAAGVAVPLASYAAAAPVAAASSPAAVSDTLDNGPSFATVGNCEEGHELILQAIAANGVKKMFFCGGTDNFYFMESVAKFKAKNWPTPDLITVMHESDAVYMNMGYSQWARRPQVTVLHVDSGTINAGAAWSEAWHADAGIVVMAGRTPYTTKNELPLGSLGARNVRSSRYDQAVHQVGLRNKNA